MPSFGEQLKREREKRSITLDDISATTKISTRLLRALEEDHFEQLPGGIFNKGFVRAYAKSVGLDADQIVADYLVASGEDQPAPTPLPEAPLRREEVEVRDEKAWSVPWGTLAVVLLMVALGLALWRNRHREETTDQPAATPAPQASVPAPTPTPVAAAPVLESTAPATAAAEPITIVVRARADCWLTLTSDGKSVFEGMLTAGGVKKITAQHGAVVKAGDVGAVDITYNGTKVPTDGQAGQVKSFSFDENGLSTVTSSTAPAAN